MKYRNLFFFMLFFTILTACGSSPAPSSGLPEEWSGTYAGAQGTVMTLVSDGTARIGHAASDETIDMDSSWDFADDVITVHCKACGYDISSNTGLQSDGILLFKSTEPAWDPEPFLKPFFPKMIISR